MTEIDLAGGIPGRNAVGIFEDSSVRPEKGIEVGKKLVTEDKIDAVTGIIFSAVAAGRPKP